MANFPGPPFLLLVLLGSALYTQITTAQSTGQPGTDIHTTGFPPSTSFHQHQQNTPSSNGDIHTTGFPPSTSFHQHQQNTPSGNGDIHTTGFPPSTSFHQHQQNTPSSNGVGDIHTPGFPPNTSMQQHTNSSKIMHMATTENLTESTSSRMSTISPTFMPSTTTEKLMYNCSLEKVNDSVLVKIQPAPPADVTWTLTSLNLTKRVNVLIPQKSLNPCRNYTVIFSVLCNDGNKTFTTRNLDVKRDVNYSLYTNKVYFYTNWSLEFKFGKYVEINASNACTDINLTAEYDHCQARIDHNMFTLPPEKPVIKFENRFPTELKWTNRAENCKNNLTYSCNSSSGVNEDVKMLLPFVAYNCTGSYNFSNEIIESDPIIVLIDCDMNITLVSDHVSNYSIQKTWNISSSNCKDISNNTSWKRICNLNPKIENCTGNSCILNNLKPYTEYRCTIQASYRGKQFLVNITERTLPAKPNVTVEKVQMIDHNSVKIKCNILEWNGEKGTVIAELFGGSSVFKKVQKDCLFQFENLDYLTTYTVKIHAKNGDGLEYLIQGESFSTKYNDKALLGFLGFLIVLTSIALLFVLYKIYLLKREKSRNEQEMHDLLPPNALLQVEPISFDALLEVYKKKRADEGRLFMEEFQSVPRIYSNYSVKEAKKSENQPKNRYVDILPYDYNRVPLSHGRTTDYINASFIEGYKETNKYIAAQGPKEETVGDFWTMIWEQKTSIIVMVTRCEEGNKNKCSKYWPSVERETEIFDDMVVKIKGEEKCPDYIISHLTLMNRKEKVVEREVTHIQFTSWPDHGVPSDPGLLLKLRRRVNSFKNVFSGPIVVHCSAGVGRTGTYICIDAMIESLEAEGRVDIYGYVVKLRRQRCLMVQVEAQYVLIHMALIEYSQFGETEIALSDFHSEMNSLRQKEGNDPSLMELEFQKLPKFKNYRPSNTAHTAENKGKNRFSIVPYDFNRVLIKLDDEVSHDSEVEDDEEYTSDEDDEVPSKYINASYVDGYWLPSSFIVTQGPMANTVADFLHMLYQKRVKTVFMLTTCTENDKEFCTQYWDDEKKTFGEMVVEVQETENTPTYIRRCLEIQHTKRKDSHTLQQYHFLKWAGQELPSNPLDLIDMMRNVRQRSENSSNNKNLPILVHCSDGASRSGIFCALWKLLDSADTEKLVDIFQVAKDLRKARMGIFNTTEQYEFLYAALEAAYPVQNGEVKKPSGAPADSVQVVNESTALINPSTDAGTEERIREATESVPSEKGPTEASSEPEKDLSEKSSNGPTSVVGV